MNRWQDALEVDVQIAISAADGGLWDQAKWDSVDKWAGQAAGAGLMWTSIYDRVTAISTSRGRSTMYEAASVGTAVIDIINDDGWANGRQLESGMAPLVPFRQIQVLVRPIGSLAASPWSPVWTGFVDAVSAPWRTAKSSMASLRCVDAMARLSMIDAAKTNVPREDLNVRLDRIANMAGWTGPRDFIDAYNVVLQAGTLDTNLLTEAQTAAYTGAGYVFASLAGALSFKFFSGGPQQPTHLYNLSNGAVTNPDGTWCPNLPVAFPGAATSGIYNRIELGNTGQAVTLYQNASSQSAYGVHPWSRTDLDGDVPTTLAPLGAELIAHTAWPRTGHLTYNIDLPSGIRLGPPLNLALLDFQDAIDVNLTMSSGDGPPWKPSVNRVRPIGIDHSITESTWTVDITADHRVSNPPLTAENMTITVNDGVPPRAGVGVWVSTTSTATINSVVYGDFGDGYVEQLPSRGGTPPTWSQIHAWATPGTYTVTAYAPDNGAYGDTKITVTA